MNDLDLIQELRSEVRQSDPRALHAARERLLAAMVPTPPARRPRPMMLRLAGVGALGLTIVIGVTVVRGPDGTGSTEVIASAPAWAPVAGVESLAERATAAAAKVTDTYPRADQWLYTKARIYISGKESMPGAGRTQFSEMWRRGDGKQRARRYDDGGAGKAAGTVPPSAMARSSSPGSATLLRSGDGTPLIYALFRWTRPP